ncbi:MlaD family protein [Oryzibacter oryziterrae]|uniref:MlaD family protein n=1 Tax=Oryzibacter oryziterrae TaxID=2766474 RepID=UPI001F3E0EB2|nr:MlaD family protein [Oryzibacter oryziterrae]
MESRANYAAIGAFVLAMLAVGIGMLAWLANAGKSSDQAPVRVVFAGSVTGLSVGSSVLFNGIKIGEVQDLSLDPKDPRTVVGVIRVDRAIPLKTDTRAILSYQGLTGAANLQLEGGSRNAPLLFDSVEGRIPTIQAEISPFQDILESARNVLNRADNAMGAIDDFISENGPAFNHMVNNAEKFTAALADNSDGIGQALASVSEAATSIHDIAVNLKGSTQRAEELLNAVDPAKVAEIVDQLKQSSEKLNAVLDRANTVAGGIDPKAVNDVMANISDAAKTLDTTVAKAHDVLAALDPKDVDGLVASLTETAQSIKDTAKRASDLMAAVDQSKVQSIMGSVDTATKNIADVSSTLGGVVDRTREAVASIGEVVGAVDPTKVRSTVDDVSAFAGSLKDYTPRIDAILADVKTASASLADLGNTIKAHQGDVDVTITNAKHLVEQLNGIAERTDGVVAKVDKYVDGDGQGLVKEATEAAKSIREIADTLNAKIGPITDNVARFSGRGLDSVTQLSEEGRQALARLERVLASVEQNPQQFIFGGDSVPEYGGRRK